MSMFLLTPPSPSRTKVFQQTVNEASPNSRFAGKSSDSERPKFDVENLPPLQKGPSQVMTTSHRGLEHGLPPGTILPDPLRSSQSQHPGHGGSVGGGSSTFEADDRARSWQYQAKSEEERRRQEEERRRQEELRVRQEELRLDQRKTEERMLRESISSGVHPNLVPLIFVGLGAGNVAGSGFEMAQQYIRQFQQVGQQVQNTLVQNSSPDQRRDLRITGQPQYGAIQPQTAQFVPHGSSPSSTNTAQVQTSGQSSQQAATVYPSPAYQSPQASSRSLVSGSSRFNAPSSNPVPPTQTALPRLTTNEAQVQYGTPGQSFSANVQTHSHSQSVNNTPNLAQEGVSSSPSIYFHHWQPPQTTNNSTPSSSQKVSPKNSSGDPSPRKRKAQGGHQAVPAPSSNLNQTSPAVSRSSSTSSRRGERRRSSVPLKENSDIATLQKKDSSRSEDKPEATKYSSGPTPSEEPATSEVQSSKDPESKPNT